MNKNIKVFGVAISTLTLSIASSAAFAYTGQNLEKHAKVSLAQARATALRSHRGVITDQELEREGGGTGLRYSFDIKGPDGTQEVGVDARTGKVLENAKEGPHPD